MSLVKVSSSSDLAAMTQQTRVSCTCRLAKASSNNDLPPTTQQTRNNVILPKQCFVQQLFLLSEAPTPLESSAMAGRCASDSLRVAATLLAHTLPPANYVRGLLRPASVPSGSRLGVPVYLCPTSPTPSCPMELK